MGPGPRYLLMQLPAAAVAGAVLYAAYAWWHAPAALCIGLFVVWVVKDAALYPFVRDAYTGRPSEMVGVEKLVGSEGTCRDALDPGGYVRVRGELWRAESVEGSLEPGAPVRVRSVEGLTLSVERVPADTDR